MNPADYLSPEDELALISIGAPALLRLLRKREESARRKLYAEYQQGITDLRPACAAWAAYIDLIRDFEQKLKERDSKKGIT